MKLHGPAHPSTYRVKVGNWGDRHYRDPLPACDIAPATEDIWPSVTTIKKAAGGDWSFVSLGRAAQYVVEHGQSLIDEKLNVSAMTARFNQVNRSGLEKAGDRGSSIHSLIEARATGEDYAVIPEAEVYIPAVDQFLADCQPEWLLSEVVGINRTVGYGGSLDAGLRFHLPGILDGIYVTDWKTRTSADKHSAYPEERWQVSGYIKSEYIIVEQSGQAVRQRMPHIDGGLIVSIAPEGYAIYVIDLDESWDIYQALAVFSKKKNAQPRAPGKPLYIPRSTPMPADPDLVDKLRAEVLWIKQESPTGIAALAADWPDGVPTFTQGGPTDADQTTLLAMLVERVKRDHNVPFNPADNPPPVELEQKPAPLVEVKATPDEGEEVALGDREALAKALTALPEPEQAWIGYIAKQAHEAGAGISVKQRPTVRRFEIARGLIIMAPHGEDELLRALVALAVDDDSLTSPALPAGAVVASLGAVEAAAFAALCEQYAHRGLPTVVGEDNRLRVQRAAA